MNDIFKEITEFNIKRRDLPHWQSPGSSYFITSRSFEQRIFEDKEKSMIFDAIKFHNGKKYLLFAAVVMPYHIHILIKPMPTPLQNVNANPAYFSLSEIMHSIKSYTAHKAESKLWQHESFDRMIRNEKEFLEKMQYIVMNPLRAGICKEPSEYQWLYYSLE